MKGPVKIVVLMLGMLVVAGVAFWGGTAYQRAQSPTGLARGGLLAADGAVPGGGPMASMTDEQRAEFEDMTDEERLEFMQENFGDDAARAGGPMRGGTLEGEVIEVADDTLTLSLEGGGSQTVYTDEDTIVAYAEGAGDLAPGAQVTVIAEPAADGVTTASLVVVE
ncbi:MAG: DUF5666 domain-containing protein [Coriobacteriia bacterium]|nr:DUF5666 domain-containing protein [Coriobacteriia bacterium]